MDAEAFRLNQGEGKNDYLLSTKPKRRKHHDQPIRTSFYFGFFYQFLIVRGQGNAS
jgi:hypothetical protein